MNNDELMHYGVKGQKWGVRKQIGQKAKIAANLERRSNAYANSANRALKKQQKLQNKRLDKHNALSDYGQIELANSKYGSMSKKEQKLFERYANHSKIANTMWSARNIAIKDLSQKDIDKGRKYITKARLTGYAIGGPIGQIAVDSYDKKRADKFVEDYKNRIK